MPGHLHDDALASAINCKASNLNAMELADVLDHGSLSYHLDQLLASISVLVNLANVARVHCLVEGDVDGQVNATVESSISRGILESTWQNQHD